MPTVNTTGDAILRPLLVYHSENPRALKGIGQNILLVFHLHPSSWNVQVIFFLSTWVHQSFCWKYSRENNLDNRCLLIVENCAARPPGITEYGNNIPVLFFLPNTTLLIQPCLLGLTAIIKAYYVQNVMLLIVSAIDREANSKAPLQRIWKDYNIKLAVTNFGDSLDGVTIWMWNGT